MVRAIGTSIRRYDAMMYHRLRREYYGGSDFFNFGYWPEGTTNQAEACENLMEKLVAFLCGRRGVILDVACGMGASTRHLLKYYDASNIVGINISAKQLETSRKNAPGCNFILMDAARLAFQDGQFEGILCVESAFHFDTREKFVQEAYRILRPGGRLVLSDALERISPWRPPARPKANYVKNIEEYRDIYVRAGFREVQVVEATDECWKPYRRSLMRWAWKKLLVRDADMRTFGYMLFQLVLASIMIKHYLLVSAKKA